MPERDLQRAKSHSSKTKGPRRAGLLLSPFASPVAGLRGRIAPGQAGIKNYDR